ncbi:hypothetical protein H2200_000352 [Cladophialophora chaetospira]|uniref:Uncharacterized protein n=1 Tax=Cladophialophora chaetospira TaxID=386627 RepID=A0AA38XN90_9EURO|nr:hypothetical protein H2200_000352 [Cladophialophora chaetospira]
MSNSSDLYLSEGTCYFGAGQKADSHFIPCGNADLEGPQACCYEYDYCLSSNTCWDPDTVVTYIAGCTDPLFRSSKCPQRIDYPDQQWVALARCDGDDIDLWTGCAHHPDKIQIEKENCDCNKTNVLIQNPNGKDSFDEIGRLPNSTSEAITYNPTVVPSPLASDNSGGGGGGLSGGAKAGIAVGVILFVLLVAGAAFFFLRRRRQQRVAGEKAELGAGSQYGGNEKVELGSGARTETSELNGSTTYGSELGSGDMHRGTSTGTAGKSELSPQREILEMPSPDETFHRASEPENPTSAISSNDSSIQKSRRFY